MMHNLDKVKLSQVGLSCSKVAPYTLREYVQYLVLISSYSLV